MGRVEKLIEGLERRKALSLLLGLSLFILIAVADLLTPESLSFSLFYLVPLGFLAWTSGGVWPWAVAVASALLWAVDHLVGGNVFYFDTVTPFWEVGVRLGFYAIFIFSLSRIKKNFAETRSSNWALANAIDAIRESERRYQEIYENTSDGIFLIDVGTDGFRVAAFNPAMERMVGLTTAEVVGRRNEEFLPPATARVVTENNRSCVATGVPQSFDEDLVLPGGHYFWHTTLVPIRSDAGDIYRIVGITKNVTDAVLAQKAILQSEQKFTLAFQNSPDPMTIARYEDSVILEANDSFIAVFGYGRKELVGHTALDIELWADRRDRDRLLTTAFARGGVERTEVALRHKNGTLRTCIVSLRIFEIDGQKYLLSITTDVTERRRLEDALRESELRFREIFDNTSDGVFAFDVMGGRRFRFTSWNPALEEMLGIPASEAVGRLSDEVLPHDLAAKFTADSVRCLESRLPVVVDGQFGSPSGPLYYSTTLVPVENASGAIARIVGVARNISERKRAELREREHEQELFRTAKLASLGTLVSGIAHEINNPNTFIRLSSENLRVFWNEISGLLDEVSRSEGPVEFHGIAYETARRMIDELFRGIEEGSQRIEKLVKNMKDYVRGDDGLSAEIVNVNDVLDSAVMLIRHTIAKSTDSFTVRKADGTHTVRGSYHQIEQVIISLITNACEALSARSQSVVVSTLQADDSWLCIDVEDQGEGIAPEYLAQVTDPFYTTKRSSGGSGLGLAVTARIVANHGGTISFDSAVNAGTRVRVRLPLAQASR